MKEPVTKSHDDSIFNRKLMFILLIFFLLLPWMFVAAFSFMGLTSLYSVENSVEKGDFSLSKTPAVIASKSFNLVLYSLPVLKKEASLLGQGEKINKFADKIKAADEVSNSVVSIIDALEKNQVGFDR